MPIEARNVSPMPGQSETRSGSRSGDGFSSNCTIRPWRLTLRMPNWRRLLGRHRRDADRDVGHVPAVRLQHAAVVHLVELVAREDHHLAVAVVRQVPQALPHGVGGALEPVRALLGLLGREQRHESRREQVELVRLVQVLVEALGVVLREHEHVPQVRVEAVADRDVDQAVLPGDGHGGLRAVQRQREQAGAAPASQDHGQHVVAHRSSRGGAGWTPLSRAFWHGKSPV